MYEEIAEKLMQKLMHCADSISALDKLAGDINAVDERNYFCRQAGDIYGDVVHKLIYELCACYRLLNLFKTPLSMLNRLAGASPAILPNLYITREIYMIKSEAANRPAL